MPTRKPSPRAAQKKPATSAETKRKIAAHQAQIAALQGKKLTRKQLADVQWLEKLTREKQLEAWVSEMPKGDYCRLSGRQHKLIDDAARNYDLPLTGKTVNLQEALTALHDLIAANAHRLRLSGEKHELEEEKLRQQIVGLERENEKKLIDLLYAKGRAVPKDAVQEALVWLSGRLQQFGKLLESIDESARDQLADFLESLAVEIEDGKLKF